MTSEAEMRFLKEFGPRVAALVNRLQEAAGVRELRTRADLDILAAAALEIVDVCLSQHARANARPKSWGSVRDPLQPKLPRSVSSLALMYSTKRRRRVQPKIWITAISPSCQIYCSASKSHGRR